MIKRLAQYIILVAFLALTFATIPARAQDASPLGVTISPPLTEKQIKAGGSFSSTIKVTNPTNQPIKLEITVGDFKARGEEGGQEFIETENTTSFSLVKWIAIDREVTLAGGEAKAIPYTVTVPVDAEPGGHYGAVFFKSTRAGELAAVVGSGAMITPKVGSLILVTVEGDINYSAHVQEFKASKRLYVDTANTVNLFTRIQNLSSVHIKPIGQITIKNAIGRSIATIDFNAKGGNVLPDSIRRFEDDWSKKYGIGFYRAALDLTYGDGQKLTGSVLFWILPWKLLIIAIVVLALLVWVGMHIQWKKPSPEAVIEKPSK